MSEIKDLMLSVENGYLCALRSVETLAVDERVTYMEEYSKQLELQKVRLMEIVGPIAIDLLQDILDAAKQLHEARVLMAYLASKPQETKIFSLHSSLFSTAEIGNTLVYRLRESATSTPTNFERLWHGEITSITKHSPHRWSFSVRSLEPAYVDMTEVVNSVQVVGVEKKSMVLAH